MKLKELKILLKDIGLVAVFIFLGITCLNFNLFAAAGLCFLVALFHLVFIVWVLSGRGTDEDNSF